MRDKKQSKDKKTPEQEALEKHVDAMMDPKLPDAPAADAPEPKVAAVAVPIAEGPTTAPQLSPKLRKQVDAASKPLSIDKLDELAEQITGSDTPEKTKKPAVKTEGQPAEPENEAATQEDPTGRSTELDDARTDEAVDDIVAYEGDVVLAVTDATAEERNRQFTTKKPKGHPVLSMLTWTVVAAVAVLIIALCALLFMGDSLADKLGL